jgi:protein involved in polysaccharide export with SLBB domain
VGDQIVLSVVGMPALSDTFAVRAGRMLELPDMQPIPLAGVLRGELRDYLTKQIGRFVINPTVEVHPLVRVAVLGAVSRPGYYAVRPDQLVSDALMAAGGPIKDANLDDTKIRRGTEEIWKGERLQTKMASGATVDEMGLRSGDEIVISERKKRDWGAIARNSAYVAGVLVSLYAGRGIF